MLRRSDSARTSSRRCGCRRARYATRRDGLAAIADPCRGTFTVWSGGICLLQQCPKILGKCAVIAGLDQVVRCERLRPSRLTGSNCRLNRTPPGNGSLTVRSRKHSCDAFLQQRNVEVGTRGARRSEFMEDFGAPDRLSHQRIECVDIHMHHVVLSLRPGGPSSATHATRVSAAWHLATCSHFSRSLRWNRSTVSTPATSIATSCRSVSIRSQSANSPRWRRRRTVQPRAVWTTASAMASAASSVTL